MKNKILTLTASLATLAALASPVKAGDRGDKVAAAIGGFIGGVIVGSHIDRDRRPPVVYAPSPAYCPPHVVVSPPPPRGYWQDVTDRVWVSERWVVSYDNCGRRVRSFVPGYYDYRTRRVWVEYTHGHGRGPGRDYAYGYSGRR